nr:MAG TPA_asm: hypothetical protein [Caudoviricetes sp.]
MQQSEIQLKKDNPRHIGMLDIKYLPLSGTQR